MADTRHDKREQESAQIAVQKTQRAARNARERAGLRFAAGHRPVPGGDAAPADMLEEENTIEIETEDDSTETVFVTAESEEESSVTIGG